MWKNISGDIVFFCDTPYNNARLYFWRSMKALTPWLVTYCATCVRLRSVLTEAPWSSFDLISGSLVWWIGLYLLFVPNALIYEASVILTVLGSPIFAGIVFVGCGLLGWLTVCWPSRPPFWLRLASRAGTAYCMILLFAEDYAHNPPPLSTLTHLTLVVAAAWGIIRTKQRGG